MKEQALAVLNAMCPKGAFEFGYSTADERIWEPSIYAIEGMCAALDLCWISESVCDKTGRVTLRLSRLGRRELNQYRRQAAAGGGVK